MRGGGERKERWKKSEVTSRVFTHGGVFHLPAPCFSAPFPAKVCSPRRFLLCCPAAPGSYSNPSFMRRAIVEDITKAFRDGPEKKKKKHPADGRNAPVTYAGPSDVGGRQEQLWASSGRKPFRAEGACACPPALPGRTWTRPLQEPFNACARRVAFSVDPWASMTRAALRLTRVPCK